jgi:hypothetical protein
VNNVENQQSKHNREKNNWNDEGKRRQNIRGLGSPVLAAIISSKNGKSLKR